MENCEIKNDCNNRREFLVKTTAAVGGLMLAFSTTSNAQTAEDVTVKIDDTSALSKVGGSQTVETKSGKVIVVRTADLTFKAFSAKCTHSGGPLQYDAKSQQLTCDWHGSAFDLEGKVKSKPAKNPLPVYSTQNAIVVNVK
jgi:Rieske Fe-S protein